MAELNFLEKHLLSQVMVRLLESVESPDGAIFAEVVYSIAHKLEFTEQFKAHAKYLGRMDALRLKPPEKGE